MNERALVLGGTGMLGSMVVRVLREAGCDAMYTFRPKDKLADLESEQFDALDFVLGRFPEGDIWPSEVAIVDSDWIINCIGVTKPMIDEKVEGSVENAIQVNAVFPHLLAKYVHPDQKIIQIATDCVFSGRAGGYIESSPHDAEDVYGKTKSLGEVITPNAMHLRTSIIGPERRQEKRYLLEWALGQPQGGVVRGFVNHFWNGVTTLNFAKLCLGVIRGGLFQAGVQHILPDHSLPKHELLAEIYHAFGRNDIGVTPRETPADCDRRLSTLRPDVNRALWQAAGYEAPPTIREMLTELAEYVKQ